jgi:hypothetical protein
MTHKTLSLILIILFKRFFKYKNWKQKRIYVFFKKVGGRCGCVYGTKGAVDRKSLGTTGLDQSLSTDYLLRRLYHLR